MTQTARPVKRASSPNTSDSLISLNPDTGDIVGVFQVHDADAVAAAVARARAASQWWQGQGFAGRKAALLRWASFLVARSEEFSSLVTRENGKPDADAYLELILALEHVRWAAKNAEAALKSRSVAPGPLMANFAASVEYKALGVVGVIGPWNYPIYTPMGSLAYALAAGNTVVFKPSEYTTAIGTYLVDAFAAANPEAPDGVLTLVTGYGATGAALCASGVDKIAFTGSTATGKKIMAACAETLTPVLLECGGKDALIVAEDADVPAAAQAAAFGAMANAGQTCVGVERVYVVEAVRDEFLTALRRELEGVCAGKDYGPMTMPGQVDVVRRHVEDAIASGAELLVGGVESIGERCVDPIVLVDADESCSAVQEETFGPTVTVRTVKDVDEAIELTNNSEYGLGSTVYSKRHGMDIARRINAGQTSVNAPLAFAAIPALPFGGIGQSGFGRIHGQEGLREFARPHSIARQRFTVPGMALLTFDRNAITMRLVRHVVSLRHSIR